MASRLLSFAVWALVSASALFWGVKLFAQAPSLPDQVQLPTRPVLQVGDLARLLGASAADDDGDAEPAPAGSERFALLGVVAPRGAAMSSQGVALIAIDGQPAKAFKTGSVVVDDLTLLAVEKRLVRLGPKGGPSSMELSLPEPEQMAAAGAGGANMPMGRPMGMQGGFPGQPGAQGVPRPGLPLQPGQVPGQPQAQVNSDDEEEE
jgi:general secretion pathway protein C